MSSSDIKKTKNKIGKIKLQPINALTRRGYVIHKDNITSEELVALKEKLYITPDIPEEYNKDIKPYPMYHENETTITLPRFFGAKRFGELHVCGFNSVVSKFKFNGKLRPEQQDIVNTVIPKIKKHGGGLISLPCGYGKTVIGINIAFELKYKTLVLVHKTFLQDQWVSRIKQFTDAKIGVIRQNVVDVEGKDIVIGMIQSISKRKYDMSIFDQFGFVIVDECHHIASRVFSRSLYKAGANYVLGLSATPKRTDGLTHVLHWYLGAMLFRIESKPNSNVVVRKFNITSQDPLFIEKTQWTPVDGGKRVPMIPTMITNIARIRRRNHLILDTINALRINSNRKILILSGRIEHLEYLKKRVDKSIQDDVDTGKLLEDDCKTCYYIGKLKADERKDAEKNGDILFASYEMAQEGLDIDRLNTVILATPKKDVVQAIGRIMRRILTKSDLKPLIIDFADNLSVLANHAVARQKLYAKNNYCIKEYMVDDNFVVSANAHQKAGNEILEKDNLAIKTICSDDNLDDIGSDIKQIIERQFITGNNFDACIFDD